MFWLPLTSEVFSMAQVRVLSRELAEKPHLPKFVDDKLDVFLTDLHL